MIDIFIHWLSSIRNHSFRFKKNVKFTKNSVWNACSEIQYHSIKIWRFVHINLRHHFSSFGHFDEERSNENGRKRKGGFNMLLLFDLIQHDRTMKRRTNAKIELWPVFSKQNGQYLSPPTHSLPVIRNLFKIYE